MNAEAVGIASLTLGAGRRTKEDIISPAAGILLAKRTGDAVRRGDLIATLFTDREEKISEAGEIFLSSLEFSSEKPKTRPIVYKIISSEEEN